MTPDLHQAYTLLQQGQPQAALTILLRLAKPISSDPNVALMRGVAQSMIGDKESAVLTYQELLRDFPNHPAALINLGADLFSLGRLDEALKTLSTAKSATPDNPMVDLNLGNVYKALGQIDDALNCYDAALSLNHNYSEARSNRGDALCQLGRVSEAISDYKEAIQLNPANYEALHNLGLTYIETKRFEEGLDLVNRALAFNPNFAVAYNTLGIGLVRSKRIDAGIVAYQRAISLAPDLADPYFNLAETFAEQRQFHEAIKLYELAIERSDHPTSKIGALLHAKMKICDWSDYESLTQQLLDGLMTNNCAISPFTILGLPSSAALQKHAAINFSAKVYPIDPKALLKQLPSPHPDKSKIRVGYLSSDFYAHATAYLIAELFELHDRQRFEIVLFSYGSGPDDAMRARLINAVDVFHRVSDLSDVEIAEKIRAAGIDILIDLKGHTQDARLGILSHRPAPIQAHYIGYPGTLGTKFIDYLVADNYLIGEKDHVHYSEKIIHLPGSYQVNDRHRKISQNSTSRTEHGLPENAFVFCCFNNNWKITPQIFDIWMRLLSKISTSVLWLLEDNSSAANNLGLEAQSRGIDPARLVFAPKLPLPEHLARHQHADLFLDTPYYNAHTTASDALWAGLPVLTVQGTTFAGRVGGSLLSALNLPEMIAPDLNAYEARALEIANNPNLANDLRTRLQSAIATAPLFDTPEFVRNIESAYKIIFERWRQGLAPDHIRVAGSQV